MVTDLENESSTGTIQSSVTEGYELACRALESALVGLHELPPELRPQVDKIVRLQAIARHSVTGGLDKTSKGLTKVRAARTALGRNTQGGQAVFGSTGVDCNISG